MFCIVRSLKHQGKSPFEQSPVWYRSSIGTSHFDKNEFLYVCCVTGWFLKETFVVDNLINNQSPWLYNGFGHWKWNNTGQKVFHFSHTISIKLAVDMLKKTWECSFAHMTLQNEIFVWIFFGIGRDLSARSLICPRWPSQNRILSATGVPAKWGCDWWDLGFEIRFSFD